MKRAAAVVLILLTACAPRRFEVDEENAAQEVVRIYRNPSGGVVYVYRACLGNESGGAVSLYTATGERGTSVTVGPACDAPAVELDSTVRR